jgi:hypothetical protein
MGCPLAEVHPSKAWAWEASAQARLHPHFDWDQALRHMELLVQVCVALVVNCTNYTLCLSWLTTTEDSRNVRQQGRSRRCGPLVGRAHIRSSSHLVCLHSEPHSRDSTVVLNNNTLDSPQTGLSPHWGLIQVRVAASCSCSAHRSAADLSELTAQTHRTGLASQALTLTHLGHARVRATDSLCDTEVASNLLGAPSRHQYRRFSKVHLPFAEPPIPFRSRVPRQVLSVRCQPR